MKLQSGFIYATIYLYAVHKKLINITVSAVKRPFHRKCDKHRPVQVNPLIVYMKLLHKSTESCGGILANPIEEKVAGSRVKTAQ